MEEDRRCLLLFVTGFLVSLFTVVPSSIPAWTLSPVFAAESDGAREYGPPSVGQAPSQRKNAVMLGYAIMTETQQRASTYTGNGLNCTNCHFNGGLTSSGKSGGISLVGVSTKYPKFREKAGGIVDLASRINGCFQRSMNGKPLPLDSKEMLSLLTYFQWISKDLPVYGDIPWLGLKKLQNSYQPDAGHGAALFVKNCAACHGSDGQGTSEAPPLWGDRSFNDGAGMSKTETMASFVHSNMSYNNPDLSIEQALDVAAYVTNRPRPHYTNKTQSGMTFSPPGLLHAAFEPLPDQPPIPHDNPMSVAKIDLGRQLYWDARLSINGTVSCNTCHDLLYGGSEHLPIPRGVYGKIDGSRNDPTVWNAAFKTTQFWDGRAPSLEEQAKGPLFNPVEMGNNEDTLIGRVKDIPGYAASFREVFGAEDGSEAVTTENIVKAIAAFERTLITLNGPLDRFLKGEKGGVSSQAQHGMNTVKTIGCMECHRGPNFSGLLQPMGEGFFRTFPIYRNNEYVEEFNLLEDPGRHKVTKKEEDKHLWIVQTWRNIELTAPYFNNGSVGDLGMAVKVMAKTQLNRDLTTQEVNEILAFLSTLTGEFPDLKFVRLPPTRGRSQLMNYD